MKSFLRLVAIAFAGLCLLTSAGCFFTTPPPSECTVAGDCANGFVCVNGACRSDTPSCSGDNDCNTGFICENGSCVAEGGPPATCDGDLRITWEFNDTAACPDDVEDVVIQLFSPTGAAIHTSAQGDTVGCTSGERVYRNLPCGTYQVRVQGIDAADEFTWSAPQGPVNIVNDQTAAITANLAPE